MKERRRKRWSRVGGGEGLGSGKKPGIQKSRREKDKTRAEGVPCLCSAGIGAPAAPGIFLIFPIFPLFMTFPIFPAGAQHSREFQLPGRSEGKILPLLLSLILLLFFPVPKAEVFLPFP